MKLHLFTIIFLLTGIFTCQESTFKVYKIITTEDGDYVFFIKNNTVKGIIVSDNDSLTVDKTFKKIKTDKEYKFELVEEPQRDFRGEAPSGYMIILNSGKTQKIWDVRKDGEMPLIYSAKNIKGNFVKE